jgi:hypothetical protein
LLLGRRQQRLLLSTHACQQQVHLQQRPLQVVGRPLRLLLLLAVLLAALLQLLQHQPALQPQHLQLAWVQHQQQPLLLPLLPARLAEFLAVVAATAAAAAAAAVVVAVEVAGVVLECATTLAYDSPANLHGARQAHQQHGG